jgi:hypothetical protein
LVAASFFMAKALYDVSTNELRLHSRGLGVSERNAYKGTTMMAFALEMVTQSLYWGV